jgi:hypothetical protein
VLFLWNFETSETLKHGFEFCWPLTTDHWPLILGVQFFPCLAVRGREWQSEEQLPFARSQYPVQQPGSWCLGTADWGADAD